jgi:hypothetical protein
MAKSDLARNREMLRDFAKDLRREIAAIERDNPACADILTERAKYVAGAFERLLSGKAKSLDQAFGLVHDGAGRPALDLRDKQRRAFEKEALYVHEADWFGEGSADFEFRFKAPPELVARHAKVSRQTIYDWRQTEEYKRGLIEFMVENNPKPSTWPAPEFRDGGWIVEGCWQDPEYMSAETRALCGLPPKEDV